MPLLTSRTAWLVCLASVGSCVVLTRPRSVLQDSLGDSESRPVSAPLTVGHGTLSPAHRPPRLAPYLSDPDHDPASFTGGFGGVHVPGSTDPEQGETISASGSRVARTLGDVEAKRWELAHGLVDDPETVRDGLGSVGGPYGFKRETVLNTDTAVRAALTPEEYDTALSKGEMDPADLRGEHKHTDSTVPDASDPAGRYASDAYSPGDPRVTLDSHAPSDEFRGENDPEAKEIVRRNKNRAVKLDIFSIPESEFVPTEARAPGEEIGGTADWDGMVPGEHDTEGTRVTDPKVLDTAKGNGALVDSQQDTADPGTGDLKGAPSFDQGLHDHVDTEFKNPAYHQQGTTTKYIRAASEVPNDPKEPNYEGLATDMRDAEQ